MANGPNLEKGYQFFTTVASQLFPCVLNKAYNIFPQKIPIHEQALKEATFFQGPWVINPFNDC